MNTRVAVAFALVVGIGIGAVTVDTVRAQQKAPVFVVAEIDVSNPEAYAKEYAPKAQALIKKHGGRLLAASSKVTMIEGQPAKRVAVLQWESMEKVKAYFNSAEYKENRKIGNKYAKFRLMAVEGVPQQ